MKRLSAVAMSVLVCMIGLFGNNIANNIYGAEAYNGEVYDTDNINKNTDSSLEITYDDCVDFTVCTEYSEGLFAYTVPEDDYYAFDSDYTMFRRSTNTEESIVYKTDGLTVPVFNTYFKYTDRIPHFSFETSADGVYWRSVSPRIKITETENWKWIPVTYTLDKLNNDEIYVKIIFSDKSEYEWSPMLASVEFKYNYKGSGFVDCAGTEYNSSAAALKALGFIDGKTDYKFCPEDNLTRAELCKLTANILNLSYNGSGDGVFNDVDAEYWASAYIASLYKIGIINGDGNNRFMPNDNVSYIDTAKILVAALGYSQVAEAAGGYPTGYRLTAKRLGLFDDIDILDTEASDKVDDTLSITRGDAAIMAKNALEVPIMNNVSFGSDPKFKKDGNTVLSAYHGIETVVGTVTACDGRSIISDSLCGVGQLVIDGISYECVSNKLIPCGTAAELLGVQIYGYADSDNRLLFADFYNTDILDLDSDKIIGIDKENLRLKYEDENEREKSVALSANTRIVYNGRYKTRVGVLEDLDMVKLNCGSIRAVINGGGAADSLIVTSALNYVAANDGDLSKGITTKNDGILKIDFGIADCVEVTAHGDAADYRSVSVKKGNVISAVVSEDGGVAVVNIYDGSVAGTVKYIGKTENQADKITINDKNYNLSPGYKPLSGEIKTGDEVTLYLDVSGFAFASEITGAPQYAYLCSVGTGDVFGGNIPIKLLTSDGEINEYTADGNTKLNGNKDKVGAIAALQPGLVRITQNDGVIKTIELPKENLGVNNADEFSISFTSDSCKYYSGAMCVFASVYQLDADTPVFIIPKNVNDYEKYKVGDRYSLFSDYEYKVCLYDFSYEFTVGAAVVYMDGSRERVLQSYDNTAIIRECSVINNSDGEACLKLDVYQNGEETAVYFDNLGGDDMTYGWLPDYTDRITENGNSIFKGGEVIQQYSDSEAHCRSFRMLLTEEMIKNNITYESNIGDYGSINDKDYFSELYTAYGCVKHRFADKLIISTVGDRLRTVPLNNTRVYKYNQRKATVDLSYASDIYAGDYAFVKMSYGDTTDIMVVGEQ